jgi:DNA-binding FrmR family transcriptional regulator
MSHTIRDKKKLLDRVRRIRGQMEGIEKALEQEKDPALILQSIAACRGAINGLMGEVIEGHIRLHILNPDHQPTAAQVEAVDQVIDVLRTYLK